MLGTYILSNPAVSSGCSDLVSGSSALVAHILPHDRDGVNKVA